MKLTATSLAILTCFISTQATAADAPKRKSGLWEITMQMEGMPAGMPGQGPMQMCIDQNSDNMMQERHAEKMDCPVMDVKQGSGKVTVHSVCKVDAKTTATTDAVMMGDFNKSYHSDMMVKYNPPKDGMSSMKITHDARWLGPCKAGQKPGDVIMPGMPAMNPGQMQDMQKMMNDPKFREMMHQQHQPR